VLSWTLGIELFILSTLSSRVLYRLYLVCIEFCWRHTGWMSIEHCWNYTKSFFSFFHPWCSVIMEDSTDIELYVEIIGNPAYSSSYDTSKSDPVSFQLKEPRLTECREEDFFARARSRPDPRIISHALAGKNSQQPRSCDTFIECVSSRREFYDNSTNAHFKYIYIRHICDRGFVLWTSLPISGYASEFT